MKTSIIKKIVGIEAKAYPPQYQQMQYVATYHDLATYCEGVPHVITWDAGYILYTKREVVDLASLTPMTLKQLREVGKKLKSFYGNRRIMVDCRESTSYRIFRFFVKKGVIKIHEETQYNWEGEYFREIIFSFS